MKKLKSIIAAALCLVMLCACAVAEGCEFGLRDVVIQIDDMALDLSGIEIIADIGADQGRNGIALAIATEAGHVLDAAAALNGSDLVLTCDGLSKSYKINVGDVVASNADFDFENLISTFNEEDLAKLTELGLQAFTMLGESMQDAGTVDYEGNTYQKTDFALTSEQVNTLLLGGADFIDAHPEIVELLGVDSVRGAIEGAAINLAIEGSLYTGDAGIMADVYLKGNANALIHVDFITETDAETGLDKILVTFTAGEQEGEEYPPEVEVSGCVAMKEGEPCYAEFYVGEAENDADNGAFIKFYMPDYQADGKIELLIYSIDNEVRYDVLIGENENGGLKVDADLTIEDNKLIATLTESEAGVYAVEVNANIDGTSIDLKANVTINTPADGWLLVEKDECVDILNMSDSDLEQITNEALSLALKVVGQLGQVNQTIASLIGDLAA